MELLFGGLIPTCMWGLFLVLGLMALGSGLIEDVSAILKDKSITPNWGGLFTFLVLISGAIGLISLWLLILFGPHRIRQRPALCRFVIGSVLLGEAAAVYAVWFFGFAPPIFYPDIVSRLVFSIVTLGGPMVVGVLYLRRLLRSA